MVVAHWENLEKSRSGLVATRVRIGTALGRYFYFLLIRESRVGLFTSSDSYSQFSAERRLKIFPTIVIGFYLRNIDGIGCTSI